MIAIKDMEMPKDCYSCDMTYEDKQLHDICKLCYKDVSYIQAGDKDVDCPLVEIVTCKDCKYCKKRATLNGEYLWCVKDCFAVSEDYYCCGGARE